MKCFSFNVLDYIISYIIHNTMIFFMTKISQQSFGHRFALRSLIIHNTYTMAHRLLVNVIFTGASVFGRAFTEAYKQAAKASAAGAAAGGPAKAASQGGISTEEAMKILNLEKNEMSLDKLEEKYNYLFDVNSKEKGNSFYLQSKVYYAMDTLKKELEYLEKLKENQNGAASG
ncbi:Pam16 maltase [Candida orthopsilosis Co 90-125]|uniref:Mitochondrial import inner membrane translocase subunit TIM16 n=1 Tax=Candida orthopsilosis (strain 90-125) TaxID=1136231 RepID=H8X9U6_CANO9|nr:Pam16 maltase [Candida orthopsilosis Co 90-125]CCG24763.1 Pam16 maltase [Candida orthopsilosis Co 90-125]